MSKREPVVKSGTYCKCGACGHEGYAYGVPTSVGVTAAFFQKFGINNQLFVLKKWRTK